MNAAPSPAASRRPTVRLLAAFCLIFGLALVIPNLLLTEVYYPAVCSRHASAAGLTFIAYTGTSRRTPALCRYQGDIEIAVATLGGWPVAASRIFQAAYTPLGAFALTIAILIKVAGRRTP